MVAVSPWSEWPKWSDLYQQAAKQRHRYCLIVSGDPTWTFQQITGISQHDPAGKVLHVSTTHPSVIDTNWKVATPCHARGLLGQEFSTVVYDCHPGIDADALGIVAGTIKAGGLLLIRVPPIEQWPTTHDIQFAKSLPIGWHNPDSSHYISRLIGLIKNNPHCILLEQGVNPTTVKPVLTISDHTDIDLCDQKNAVQCIKKVALGKRRRPIVLLADRGRGKSAALGNCSKRACPVRGWTNRSDRSRSGYSDQCV